MFVDHWNVDNSLQSDLYSVAFMQPFAQYGYCVLKFRIKCNLKDLFVIFWDGVVPKRACGTSDEKLRMPLRQNRATPCIRTYFYLHYFLHSEHSPGQNITSIYYRKKTIWPFLSIFFAKKDKLFFAILKKP